MQSQRARLRQRPAPRCSLVTHHRIFLFLALIGCASPAFALSPPSPPVLRSVRAIRRRQTSASAPQIPVHIHAVVTYYDSVAPNLFVQDSTGGIWVDLRNSHRAPPRPGQVLDLRGIATLGFSPYIASPRWTVVSHAPPPRPISLSWEEAITGTEDAQWVRMMGVVRSFVQQAEGSVLVIDVATPLGGFKVRVPDYHAPFPMPLVDAKVRFDGVLGAVFNRRNQLVAINLLVPSFADTNVLDPAPPDPFALPTTPVAGIRRFSSDLPDVHRVKVQGIVTADFPRQGLYLMDSTGGLYAESQDGTPLHAGDEVAVIGFPAKGDYSPVLRSATILPLHTHLHHLTPLPVTGALALHGGYDAQLVSIPGTIRSWYQDLGKPVLLIESGDHTNFQATFASPVDPGWAPPVGSTVRLTGICTIRTDENGNPATFTIVLRTPEDIAVLSSPPWLNARRAVNFVLFLLALTMAVLAWVVILRRRVRRQTGLIRANLETELALEERYRRIFERNLTGLYIAREDGALIDCNDACARTLGFSDREDLLANRPEAQSLVSQFHQTLTRGSPLVNAESHFHRRDGSWAWALSSARLVPQNGDGTLLLEGALVDITDRKLADEQIQLLAYYDSLTGLPNRTLLRDRLTKALAGARRHREKMAILFLDVDRFKTINDSLGHTCGDLLLRQLGQRLQSCAREQDTVARLGGDEFLIALGAIDDPTDAALVAERVAQAVDAEFDIQGHLLNITCSIGISVFPDHGQDVESLIKNADAAMYSSKDAGRNTFRFFTEQLTAQVQEHLTLENSLRSALQKQQLFLVYQPEVSIATGSLTCWEALVRWRHPELGLVPPDRFIRIAESSGMILAIGEWVLRTACAQAQAWRRDGLHNTPVAVNVSAVQFRQDGFCDIVRKALRDTGLPAGCLELELTESLLLSNEHRMFQVLGELKAMGVHLAIDDFGTGYSSLSYLRQFPVAKLKIDRSFIRDLAGSADGAAITAAIVNMARCLNLRVTAEGVENQEQLAILRRLGCDDVQGYWFSKPLAVAEATAWWQRLPAQPQESEERSLTSALA